MRKLLIALLMLTPSAWGAIAFVNVTSALNETTATATCSVSPSLTAGNTEIFALDTYIFNPNYPYAPTDNKGDTFYPLRIMMLNPNNPGRFLSLWFAPNVTGGSTTITINTALGNTVNNTCYAIQFSGLGTNPTVDGTGSFSFATSGTTMSSGSTTTTAGSLLIGFGDATTTTTSCSAGAGYTQPAGGSTAQSNTLTCIEYNLSSAGGSTSATQTFTGSSTLWTYALGALAVGNSASVPPYTPAAQPSNGFSISLGAVTGMTQAAPTEAFPTPVVAPNGNWLLFYQQTSGGQGSSAGGIGLRTSTNKGATWTDFGGTNYGCNIGTFDYTGCIFSGGNSGFRYTPNYGGGANVGTTAYTLINIETTGPLTCAGVQISSSTDNGASWSSPANVATGVSCTWGPLVAVPGGSVSTVCPSGCLLAPVSTSGTQKILISTDGGATWPTSHTVSTWLMNQFESYIVWTAPDTLTVFSRRPNYQSMLISQSTDMGSTWSFAFSDITTIGPQTSGSWNIISPFLINPNLGDSRYTMLFGDRNGNGASIRAINQTLANFVASPQGLPGGQTLNSISSINISGYPAALPISQGKWMFFWDEPASNPSNSQIFTSVGQFVSSSMSGGAQMSGGTSLK